MRGARLDDSRTPKAVVDELGVGGADDKSTIDDDGARPADAIKQI